MAITRNSDKFTQGYVEAMFFTDTGYQENGDLENADISELSPELVTQIEKDCTEFNLKADAWLHKAYLHDKMDYTMEQAGHDFWLTRNHHGAGFWDRGLGVAGEKLTEIAHSFGEVCIYRGDDGQIHA